MSKVNASKSHQDESVKAILARINDEYHAASLGFTGLSLGTSRHDFINHRMENIALAGRQLVGLLGENEAGRLIVEQMNKSADKGEL
jgi:hypothetical protein